jgi:uncharacterized membrane protein YecN with MAPEG domain
MLALLVSRQRLRTRTMLGAGGNPALERAIRAHGNFVEYVPLILLLLALLALDGLGAAWLHVMGIALTLGRILHGWGLSTSGRENFGRSAGIVLTWLAMLAALVLCILRGAAALGGGGTIG